MSSIPDGSIKISSFELSVAQYLKLRRIWCLCSKVYDSRRHHHRSNYLLDRRVHQISHGFWEQSSFSLIAGIIKFGPIAHFIVMSPAFGRKTECVPQNFSSILLVNMKLNQCMRRILLDKIAHILGMFLVNTLQPIGRATAAWSRHGGILGTILIH